MNNSLLEECIQSGDVSRLRRLLNEEPELALAVTSHHISPLMLSCYYKKPEITSVLLEYVRSPSLFEACAAGEFDRITQLYFDDPTAINRFSEDGFTPLALAAYFGHEDIVRYLLFKGADPNIASSNGYNVYPLHSAVAADHSMIAKMLLEAGADINVVQMSGGTPLHSAAGNGNIELIISLLEAGANVSAVTSDGKKPADLAQEKGFADIAAILSE